jgi:hypothetical protein
MAAAGSPARRTRPRRRRCRRRSGRTWRLFPWAWRGSRCGGPRGGISNSCFGLSAAVSHNAPAKPVHAGRPTDNHPTPHPTESSTPDRRRAAQPGCRVAEPGHGRGAAQAAQADARGAGGVPGVSAAGARGDIYPRPGEVGVWGCGGCGGVGGNGFESGVLQRQGGPEQDKHGSWGARASPHAPTPTRTHQPAPTNPHPNPHPAPPGSPTPPGAPPPPT